MNNAPWDRLIIHADLDAFFASVEQLIHPELVGKPVIVGGSASGRGVVSSASYEARRFGVRSAMPTAQAIRLCPQAIVVWSSHHIYSDYSRRVMDILRSYTPDFEQISIDEAFLDMTGSEHLFGAPYEMALRIQRQVDEETHLSLSLGVASSKMMAKVACEFRKPHGITVVEPGHEQTFLAPLDIEKLWGVGHVGGERLRSMGVETIGDLAAWSREMLDRVMGKQGDFLYNAARGLDSRPVMGTSERQGISHERTFAQDITDPGILEHELLSMCEYLGTSLRKQQRMAQVVRIKLRYFDFETITRQIRLKQPTDQHQIVCEQAASLLWRHWDRKRAVRLLGVGVSGLLEGAGYQLQLFGNTDQRQARLNQALDEIRDRYGRDSILPASMLDSHPKKDS